jgi:outer membrane protein TolC
MSRVPLPVVLPAALFAFTLAFPAPTAAHVPRTSPAPALTPCAPGETPEPVLLSGLWGEARERDPGYLAVEEGIAAEDRFASSVRREWLPALGAEGIGNYGQRLSPGEERVLGVGPRGEFRLVGTWTLLDSDRMGRGALASRRGREASAAGEVFDVGFRAMLAAGYVEAAAREELWALRSDHLDRLRTLAAPVRAQTEAGVDVRWEAHLVEEALARGERLLAEAERDQAQARAELSHATGRCVRAAPIDPEAAADLSVEGVSGNTTVEYLRRRAETQEAVARQEGGRGGFQLQLLGLAGPNHSRAFEDGPVRNEYLVGITGSWRPDLAGVRRQLASAERARARSVRAEAESLELALTGELERIHIALDHAGERQQQLARELEQARIREEAALLRWTEGVDRWIEVMQARDRLLELRILEVEADVEMALAWVRHGEVTGTLDELPIRLGQEAGR